MGGLIMFPIDSWIEYHGIPLIWVPAATLSIIAYATIIGMMYTQLRYTGLPGLSDVFFMLFSFVLLTISAFFWVVDVVSAIILLFMTGALNGTPLSWVVFLFFYAFVLFSIAGMPIIGITVIVYFLRRMSF